MTTRASLMAATSPFAHLIGLRPGAAAKPAPAAKKAEEDDDDTETEEDRKKREGDDKDKARRAKNKKAGRDEDDDGEKMEGDDDSDAGDEDDGEAKKARVRERGRCAAIFSDPAAGVRPDMAAFFAFRTNMSRTAAISALQASAVGYEAPKQEAPARRTVMANVPNPDTGDGGAAQTQVDADPSKADFILASYKHALGEK